MLAGRGTWNVEVRSVDVKARGHRRVLLVLHFPVLWGRVRGAGRTPGAGGLLPHCIQALSWGRPALPPIPRASDSPSAPTPPPPPLDFAPPEAVFTSAGGVLTWCR